MRRADEHVLGQPLHHAHVIVGNHHPAHAPACHGIVFGKRIDHIDIIADLKRADGAGLIFDAVINLIADESRALSLCRRNQGAHLGMVQHSTTGVGGRGHHHTGNIQIGKIRGHWLQAVLDCCGQIERLKIHRLEDLAVTGITRRADRHLVAAVKQGCEGKDKAG